MPAPSETETVAVLQRACFKLKLADGAPEEFLRRVADASGGNMRRALLMLETCRIQQFPFSATQSIALPDWLMYVREVGQWVVQTQSGKQLLRVRAALYELQAHCIPANIVFEELSDAIIRLAPPACRAELAFYAAKHEANMHSGSKEVLHIEAFVARAMEIVKRLNSTVG